MKTKFTLLLLFITIQLSAQTITYSNFSASLSATLNAVIADNSSFNTALLTTTGNSVTWNAGSLIPQAGYPVIHLIYGAPAATPYGSLFPTSNYSQYDPALATALGYQYYKFDGDSISKTGEYEPSTGAHEIYQDADKHLIFPFSYGQTFADNYAKTNYSDATTISSFQTGTRTATFNGYGTLILPQGSFTNVALVSELRTNSLGPNSTEFVWFELNTGRQLMFYSENAGSVTSAYTNDIPTGINDLKSGNSSSVFPNPFSSAATLRFNSNKHIENAFLKVTNHLGQTVQIITVNSNEIILNKESLEDGIYFYSLINSNETVSTGKFIIE